MRNCKFCNVILNPNINWYPSNIKIGRYICIACQKIQEHGRVFDARIRKYHLKHDMIQAYGGKCNICDIDIWQFLTIDHIFNDGKIDSENIGRGTTLYAYLKRNNYPKDRYQLLCYNCNSIKGNHGFIPQKINQEKCLFCSCLLNNKNVFTFNKINNNPICKICLINRSVSIKDSSISRKIEKKQNSLNVKLKIINNYGKLCKCCGYNDFYALTIDHIFGDGSLERKNLRISGLAFYRHLIKNNYPKDNYQLLCYNCNCCKGAYGKCYHELCRERDVEKISILEYIDILKD
jgi:hypothetical protein